jgi:hypothetical protein
VHVVLVLNVLANCLGSNTADGAGHAYYFPTKLVRESRCVDNWIYDQAIKIGLELCP